MDHPPCSPQTAAQLYAQLEYYREYVPYMLDMSPERYSQTQEAINVDTALKAYRDETGTPPTYPLR